MNDDPASDRSNRALFPLKFRAFIDDAVSRLRDKMAALDALIDFEQTQWSVDQAAGVIAFEKKNCTRWTAPVQIIGSFNSVQRSWLWGWANASVNKSLRRDADIVEAYGLEHGIAALTTPKVECTAEDCWELTAIACQLGAAQGAYRGPAGPLFVFMTFGQLEVSPLPEAIP